MPASMPARDPERAAYEAEVSARIKAFADATSVTMAEFCEGMRRMTGALAEYSRQQGRLAADPGVSAEELPGLAQGITDLTA